MSSKELEIHRLLPMSISQQPSDYSVKPAVIQTAKDSGMEPSQVAEVLEEGEVVHHEPATDYAIVKGVVTPFGIEQRVKLHLSLNCERVDMINRMEVLQHE